MALQAGMIVKVKSGFEGVLDLYKRFRLTKADKYGNAQVTEADNPTAPYLDTHLSQLEKA